MQDEQARSSTGQAGEGSIEDVGSRGRVVERSFGSERSGSSRLSGSGSLKLPHGRSTFGGRKLRPAGVQG